RSIANLLELRPDEKIAATIRIQGQKTDEETWNDKLHIVFATRSGIVKKSNLSDFKNIRKGGIIAIQIEEGDRLIDCKLTTGLNEIVLITKDGMSIRFNEEELRDQGRNTVGVWGIRPGKGDIIVAAPERFRAKICRPSATIVLHAIPPASPVQFEHSPFAFGNGAGGGVRSRYSTYLRGALPGVSWARQGERRSHPFDSRGSYGGGGE